MIRLLCFAVLLAVLTPVRAGEVFSVYQVDEDVSQDPDILAKAEALRVGKTSLNLEETKKQLKRAVCGLHLPAARTQRLEGRDVWQAAHRSFMRVGVYYREGKSKTWNLDLACGFFVTEDGVIATAYHVVDPTKDMREGCLVAVDDAGQVHAVKEILAGNKILDVCLLRLDLEKSEPLPLTETARPGDRVYCLSDPGGERSYFSSGIVNRLLQDARYAPDGPVPQLLDVGADWAPGSSGAAVLDEYGNAIGLVSTIFEVQDTAEDEPKKDSRMVTWMVVHEAVSAHDLLALIHAE